jgi:hypothetical protein
LSVLNILFRILELEILRTFTPLFCLCFQQFIAMLKIIMFVFLYWFSLWLGISLLIVSPSLQFLHNLRVVCWQVVWKASRKRPGCGCLHRVHFGDGEKRSEFSFLHLNKVWGCSFHFPWLFCCKGFQLSRILCGRKPHCTLNWIKFKMSALSK